MSSARDKETLEPSIDRRWTTPTRYYRVTVQRDLFGQWELICCWGGRASARGGFAVHPLGHFDDAEALLAQVERRRKQRGYQVQGGDCAAPTASTS